METESAPRMDIRLTEVSKRFGRQWVIRQLSQTYAGSGPFGIRGRNGSGKSTLLRMLAGQLSPSRGVVQHRLDGRPIPPGEVYRHVSWTGPYFELVEELSLREMIAYHFTLKPLRADMTMADVLERTELATFAERPLHDCSSGMRQRILLATALYAACPLLLLDEPTVTLDAPAADWFVRELTRCAVGRLTIIASNDPRDLAACTTVTDLS